MSEYIEFKIEDSTQPATLATLANPGNRRKASIIIVESTKISRLKDLIPTSTDVVFTCLKNNNVSAPASVSASTDTSQIQQAPVTTDNNLYSLSIKFFSQEQITVEKDEVMNGNEHIYIMPQNDDDKGKFVSISDEQKYPLKYILITGKLTNSAGNSGKTADTNQRLTIEKVFYILNTAPDTLQPTKIEEKVLTKEEFLNLYYINYFSFDNTKFTALYENIFINDASKTSPPVPVPGAGGGSKLVKKKSKIV